ncbi:MAG TPA: inorganic pyrophosphatase [Myxococcaceae bacterium]|nr:inorganic pyrophosphatase [Myxococcaceae bacterium]
MPDPEDAPLEHLLRLLFKAHPWHGISPGPDVPDKVVAYIEIVPTDTVKYELDKVTGELRLDRPQRYSSLCPSLYGFIPQTYAGALVGARCAERTGLTDIEGDGDPMDICVLSERAFTHAAFLLRAHPIGGLRMVDGNQADDKIVAVLEADLAYGGIRDLADVPRPLIERLRHYFLTYKQIPGDAPRRVEIREIYGREEACEVIRRSQLDYHASFGDPDRRVGTLRALLTAKWKPPRPAPKRRPRRRGR